MRGLDALEREVLEWVVSAPSGEIQYPTPEQNAAMVRLVLRGLVKVDLSIPPDEPQGVEETTTGRDVLSWCKRVSV